MSKKQKPVSAYHQALDAQGGLGATVVFHVGGALDKARVAIVTKVHPDGFRDLWVTPYRGASSVEQLAVPHSEDPGLEETPEVARRRGLWSTLGDHKDRTDKQ